MLRVFGGCVGGLLGVSGGSGQVGTSWDRSGKVRTGWDRSGQGGTGRNRLGQPGIGQDS